MWALSQLSYTYLQTLMYIDKLNYIKCFVHPESKFFFLYFFNLNFQSNIYFKQSDHLFLKLFIYTFVPKDFLSNSPWTIIEKLWKLKYKVRSSILLYKLNLSKFSRIHKRKKIGVENKSKISRLEYRNKFSIKYIYVYII